MAQLGKDGKVRIGGWTGGINNVAPETEIGPQELRDSVNFEYDANGVPRLRRGRTLKVSGTNCHSLWSNGVQSFYVDDGALMSLDTITWDTTQIATGFANKRLSYAQIGHRVFLSSEEKSGRVNLLTMEFTPGLGTPSPALEVVATAQAFGGLSAGRYLLGMTYLDTDLEESGCQRVISVDVEAGGSISLTMTGPRPAGVAHIQIYLSEPNGRREEMFKYGRIYAYNTSMSILSNDTGRPLETLYLEAMPSCRYLTAYNGRLYGAVGSEVVFSDAQRYGLHDPDGGSLGMYPADVTVLEHSPGGVFVVADRTYSYIGPTPGEMRLRDDAFSHRGLHGSGAQIPSEIFNFEGLPLSDIPYWFTDRGAVIGMPDGSVRPVMMGKAEPERYTEGATGVVEVDGARQIVTATKGRSGPAEAYKVSDSFSVTVYNNDIEAPL